MTALDSMTVLVETLDDRTDRTQVHEAQLAAAAHLAC
jgi:hypothetical protein